VPSARISCTDDFDFDDEFLGFIKNGRVTFEDNDGNVIFRSKENATFVPVKVIIAPGYKIYLSTDGTNTKLDYHVASTDRWLQETISGFKVTN
jgi:hypothetical protein